ncbi:hypothetical protein, partial [Candidatus Avelusimicrobium alvi]|uniref:hypothetical protein n=1 Tax=Candidatus Avelusimicrobium alvi TaxID=3416221 RepID=UPI003D12311B
RPLFLAAEKGRKRLPASAQQNTALLDVWDRNIRGRKSLPGTVLSVYRKPIKNPGELFPEFERISD